MSNHNGQLGATQTVQRALAILNCFNEGQPRLRVADVARLLGFSQSTASRLLSTMESLGFVSRDPSTGLYGVGLSAVTLAGIALNEMEVRRQAMASLSAVAADLGLVANLSILHEDAIFYVASVGGVLAPRIHTVVGRHNPLHCTAMGKVLLAHLPEETRESVLSRINYVRCTPFTVTSAEELRPILEQVRQRGYGIDREEIILGRGCIAAPVRDAGGTVIAAVSVSGPLSHLNLNDRETQLASHVIEMGSHISHRMGYITVPSTITAPRHPHDGGPRE